MIARRCGVAASMDWDEVWAEYDARQPARVAAARPLPPRPMPNEAPSAAPARSMPRRGATVGGMAMLPLLFAGWIGAPYATAWHLAHALDGSDPAGLSRHLDLPAVQGAVRQALTPGPDAPRGDQASAFLGAMADDIAAAWSNPSALAEVARARGVAQGGATQALRNAVPVGLTRFDLPLAGGAAPVTLQLELKGDGMAARWQVTGVRLAQAAPAAAPGPSYRFAGMR